jgi:hypothetical protein
MKDALRIVDDLIAKIKGEADALRDAERDAYDELIVDVLVGVRVQTLVWARDRIEKAMEAEAVASRDRVPDFNDAITCYWRVQLQGRETEWPHNYYTFEAAENALRSIGVSGVIRGYNRYNKITHRLPYTYDPEMDDRVRDNLRRDQR